MKTRTMLLAAAPPPARIPTPGHTPGTLSVIFPVRDGSARHVAAIWGGAGFNSRTEAHFRSYAASARRFAEQTRAPRPSTGFSRTTQSWAGPFEKLGLLESRKPGDAHPFVRDWASQNSLLTAGAECPMPSGFAAFTDRGCTS